MNKSADGDFVALTWFDSQWETWKGFACLRDFAESVDHDIIVVSCSEILVEECDLGVIGVSSPGIFTSEEMVPFLSEGFSENINYDIRIKENAVEDCIISLMKNTDKTPRETMHLLGVPKDKWDFYY